MTERRNEGRNGRRSGGPARYGNAGRTGAALAAFLHAVTAYPLAAGAPEPAYSPRWERSLAVTSQAARKAGEAPAPGEGAPLGRFLLDAPLFSHTRDDYADLRIFDSRGRPRAILVRPVSGQERVCAEVDAPVKRLGLEVLGDSAFEARYFAEDPERLPDRVAVSIEDRDFEISLSVWTAPDPSAEPSAWTLRLREAALFDYSRFVDLRREEAAWDGAGDRAIRLRVDGLTQSQRSLVSTLSGQVGRPTAESFQVERRLLRVEAISFRGTACETRMGGSLSDRVALSSPDPASPIREDAPKRSWYVIGAGRLPLKAVTLRVGTRNFMRSVVLAGWPDSVVAPGDTAAEPWTWPRIAEARIHRIDWAGQADSALRIAIPSPRRFATLALGVLDRDDEPIRLLGGEAEVERMEAVFPAQDLDRQGVVLRYGDRRASPLESDFGSLLARAPASPAEAWAPGTPRLLDAAAGPMDAPGPWLSGQLILTLGIAISIVALTTLLFMVARKAGRTEPAPGHGGDEDGGRRNGG